MAELKHTHILHKESKLQLFVVPKHSTLLIANQETCKSFNELEPALPSRMSKSLQGYSDMIKDMHPTSGVTYMDTTDGVGAKPAKVLEVLAEKLTPRAKLRHKAELEEEERTEPEVEENSEVLIPRCVFGPEEIGGLGRAELEKTPNMIGVLPSNKKRFSVILVKWP